MTPVFECVRSPAPATLLLIKRLAPVAVAGRRRRQVPDGFQRGGWQSTPPRLNEWQLAALPLHLVRQNQTVPSIINPENSKPDQRLPDRRFNRNTNNSANPLYAIN
ncbi:hypothetical protein [Photorhabdus cinerea]|uniref:hypothetical protein n=1 Tax=Photorhabdus cinerea TaxID=471575 RepID=UPI001409F6C0